jgi:hypothetical protein
MTDARTIPEADKDRAGVLIGEAMYEYGKIAQKTTDLLNYAIDAGSKLLEARAIFKEDKVWRKILKEKWTCSSTRTADRYMVLATFKEKVREQFDTVSKSNSGKKWTLRDAIEFAEELQRKTKPARQPRTSATPKPTTQTQTASATPDLKATIDNSAPDEVAEVLKNWTKDDREDLATKLRGIPEPDLRTLLNDAKPKEIIDAFDPEEWDADELDAIARGLMDKAQQIREAETDSEEETDSEAPVPPEKPAGERVSRRA